MPRLQVLRSFPFADDGIKAKVLEPGMEFDCPDDVAPGLIRGKLARPAGLEEEHPFGAPTIGVDDVADGIKELFADRQDDGAAATAEAVTTDEVTVGEPGDITVEAPDTADDEDDGADDEAGAADEASNDAAKDGDDQDDDDDDGEAQKEAREPIENKDAGDPDGNSAGKRTKRARKGA